MGGTAKVLGTKRIRPVAIMIAAGFLFGKAKAERIRRKTWLNLVN